jgi:glycerate kinase
MRVLIAFDKFKDSLSAHEACAAAAAALGRTRPGWTIDACPFTDGGDGFGAILTAAIRGQRREMTVTGPLGAPVRAGFGLSPVGAIAAPARALLGWSGLADADLVAVIELAAASGLAMVPADRRDPWRTTTLGTGELIRAAGEAGAVRVLLGLGGSATHDLGLGALSALGYDFLDEAGHLLRVPFPSAWERLAAIRRVSAPPVPSIQLACDVSNPLLGAQGAAAVYGPQKGLRPGDLPRMEAESARVARMLCAASGVPETVAEESGAGAAGGIAFGLRAGFGARANLVPGGALVAAWVGLESRLALADVVITGEGRFDLSSLSGKGPGGLALRARELGKQVHVFAGRIDLPSPPEGIAWHSITPASMALTEALERAAANLSRSVETAF